MSSESIKSPESIEVAIKALQTELGRLNIKADYDDDKVLPALITFDGNLDITEDANASDEDIEYVITKMNRDFKAFDFTYDKQGAVTVMPKE